METPHVVHQTNEVWNNYGDFFFLGNCAYTNKGIFSGSLPTGYYFHVITCSIFNGLQLVDNFFFLSQKS